ncbi:MAG: exodeoxyribonuclease VII large subunit [Chloroflexota bacterium]
MNPITISTLSTHIATLIENDERLRDVWVIGEVSNWKRAASGHAYFSLKDSGATINAVIWRNNANAHTWLPKSGDQIIAHGYVGLYPDRGTYQLYVNRIQPAGRGRLYEQFEALKAKLQAQGLFDDERKQPIPTPFSVERVAPYRVGIVTSATAAALRDILRVFHLRWPLIEVVLFPTLVQGHEAPAQIANAIVAANQYSSGQSSSNDVSNPTIFEQILSDQYTGAHQPLDTLILTRGGGSIEDLWAFNDERVAYAIAQSTLPIVTGIGHEIDFTIADFVADLRMPTPSAAAAAVTPDQAEVRTETEAPIGAPHSILRLV